MVAVKCCIFKQNLRLQSALQATQRHKIEDKCILFRYTDNYPELCTHKHLTIRTMQSFETKDESIQRYVDILSNGGFKALFGDIANKDVVMSIMNVFLPEHRRVVEISYLPTEHHGPILDHSKDFQFDFMCTDASGTVFIVEMQRYHEDYWFKRCVSYASRAYDRQNRKGENYNVPPVYLIGLMGTEIEHPDTERWKDRYISEYTFREKDTHDLLDETIIIIFAELTRFSKAISECQSDTDRILYILKNMGRLHNQPVELQAEVYRRIFEACEIAAFREDKRIQYERDMYDEKRLRGIESACRRIGLEEGRAQGLAEGREQGLSEGREQGLSEGRAEGRAEAQMEMGRKLKNLGVAIETITEATGLDKETLEAL